MNKSIWLVPVVLALITGAFAQSKSSATLEHNSKYEVMPWGQPPNNEWGGTISVASDGKGSILVLRRSAEPSVLVFTADGKFLRSWGYGLFKTGAHSIDVDGDGFIWTTDNEENTVYKFTPDGKLLMTLGKRGVTGDNSAHDSFDGPSDIAFAPNGNIFITDGYRNSRIVEFSKDGKFVKIIGGTKGPGPGEFNLVHGIGIDSKGRLVAIDKSRRVELFDQNGKFLEQWTDLGLVSPAGFWITKDDTIYIGDTEGGKIVMVKNGKVIDVIPVAGRPHNIAMDPSGAIYMADFSGSKMIKKIVKK